MYFRQKDFIIGCLLIWAGACFCVFAISTVAQAATSIPFTVNLSEPVVVTGTPRIAVNVGGATRYANFTSGSGTSALTFTYNMVSGDVDLDGVSLTSPIDLNGGTIKDLQNNDTSLSFTVPNTSNVKVNYPSLSMDFTYDADGRYTLNGTAYNDMVSFLSAAGGSYSRSGGSSYFDSSGVLQSASPNQPRFDYDPVTHNFNGLLFEEARINYAIYSGNIVSGNFTFSAVTSTANSTIAPDGITNVTSVSTGATTNSHFIGQAITLTSGSNYTTSVFAKAGTTNTIQIAFGSSGFSTNPYANFNLGTGSVGTVSGVVRYGIQNIGNGWYRCWATATSTGTGPTNSFVLSLTENNASATRVPSFTGTNKEIYLWGAQFERGDFVTSYIPTSSTQVTRNYDLITIPVASWIGTSDETMYAEAASIIPTANWSTIFGFDNTYTLRRYHLVKNGGKLVGGYNASPNITTTNQISAMVAFKSASSFGASSTLVALDGTVTSGAAAGRTAPTNLTFGLASGYGFNGYFRKIKYYPSALSSTQMQLMTQ